MLLKGLRYLRFALPAIALATGVALAMEDGNYAGAHVLIIGFWTLIAIGVWWAVGRLVIAVSRKQPAKTGFDFLNREPFVASVQRGLPAGESVTNFVPVFETSFVEGKFPRSRGTTLHFYGLALTTVGLRWISFAASSTRVGLSTRQRIIPDSVVSETVVRMSEITKVKSSRARCPRIEIALEGFGTGFGSPLEGVTTYDSLAVYGLSVVTQDGTTRSAWSPFREMTTLVTNLNSMRSGDFLATRASGASGAAERLAKMLDEGVLSPDEFERLKSGFIGTTAEHQDTTESRIRQLHALMKDGILTESEFRQKKWDLLSKSN